MGPAQEVEEVCPVAEESFGAALVEKLPNRLAIYVCEHTTVWGS